MRLQDWEERLQALSDDSKASWVLRCFDSCESTMEAAKDLLPLLSGGEAALILTRNQTQGRGRHGRPWNSPARGFFGTYVFQCESDPAALSSFTLVAGALICGRLKSLGYDVGLKWPNDILSRSGAKLCGVLSELVCRSGRNYLLVGIGINIAGEPPNAEYPATSLETLNERPIDPVDIAASLSNSLLTGWSEFLERGFAAFKADWLGHALFIGRRMILNPGDGEVAGVYRGVTDSGALLLDCGPAGMREIVSAHIERIDGI